MNIIYFIIAFFATFAGSITGMGGGVIIKPVFDILGTFDAQSISTLSSITVFFMALYSSAKAVRKKASIDAKAAVSVAIGSVIGANIGQTLLNMITSSLPNNLVVITQNVLLAIMIAVVYVYMKNKKNIKSFEIKRPIAVMLVGIGLGISSSFLGIGGGPINIMVFIFFFSYTTKTAATISLITILFSQISKLSLLLYTGELFQYDLSAAPFMVIGALLGAFFGGKISDKVDDDKVDDYFNYMQIIIFIICIVNIVRNI